ncbi:hypothetical protein II5_02411 [Bacillus cereus MSX-A1]|uniref:DUF3908 family protein n=1 Tax=Bacillus cereus TaxID=1396 RepID=UPI0002794ABF|nr:DUF3908 family protein [Bacillus cereus]EJR06588.1 hypothetical protein II5_02411 [Bacillus cereus MSX-A1]MDR4291801.1 DUF3908 domain-containing protein [Bacillus cereus]
MSITYAEFVELNAEREFDEYSQFLKLKTELEGLYNVKEDFVFFYPKNLFNQNKWEFIIFLKDGFLTIEESKNGFLYEQFYCKLVSKSLSRHDHNKLDQHLKMVFDNGRELTLKSLADSNGDKVREYAEAIKNLYKLISR